MAAAALQHSPITFHRRSTPSAQLQTKPAAILSLTSNLKLSKLTVKPLLRHRRRHGGGGASGARMADSAAGSYANALVDVAKANGTLEQTASDLDKIEKFFDAAVIGFFCNPTIDEKKKMEVIDEISKSASLQPHVANFLKILLDMKRIDIIKDIVKAFDVAYSRFTETEFALVTSVVPLESQHLAQIAKEVQKLTGAKNVRIKTAIDPALVAGFTIRYGYSGSKLIDMSVKKQLEDIAKQLDIGDVQLAV